MAKRSLLQPLRLGDVIVERIAIDATTQNNYIYNAACEEKLEVMSCDVLNTSGTGGACTMTLRNGTDAISDAIDVYQADGYRQGAATFDDDYLTIMPGGTLDCFLSATGEDTLIVYVVLLKVA